METANAEDLIKRYQVMVSNLLLRRAVEGPLPEMEEARLAQEQADLWELVPEDRHADLEAWIDEQVRRSDSLSRPVADYVAAVRRALLARALGSADAASSATLLAELIGRMTDIEVAVVQAWRRREESVSPVSVGALTLPFEESRNISRASREKAA